MASKLLLSSFCTRRNVFKDKGREIPDRGLYDLIIEILQALQGYAKKPLILIHWETGGMETTVTEN